MDRDIALDLVEGLGAIKGVLEDILAALTPADSEPASDDTEGT